MMGKVVSALLSAIIMVVALGAGMEVANQAGIFWGLIVAVVVRAFRFDGSGGVDDSPSQELKTTNPSWETREGFFNKNPLFR